MPGINQKRLRDGQPQFVVGPNRDFPGLIHATNVGVDRGLLAGGSSSGIVPIVDSGLVSSYLSETSYARFPPNALSDGPITLVAIVDLAAPASYNYILGTPYDGAAEPLVIRQQNYQYQISTYPGSTLSIDAGSGWIAAHGNPVLVWAKIPPAGSAATAEIGIVNLLNYAKKSASGSLTMRAYAGKQLYFGCGANVTMPWRGLGANGRVAALFRGFLGDSQIDEIARNPWVLLEADDNLVPFAGGAGGSQALEGAAAASASAAAVLSVAVPIAGTGLAVATAGGALSLSINPAGDATASANASGGLSLSVPLSAAAVAQALAQAGLSQDVPLAGGAAAEASAAGALTLNISLAGAAIATAAAAAGLTVEAAGSVDLEGAAAASASATGALTHAVPLSGASVVVTSASGALSQIVPLAGAAASASMATGGLDIAVNLSAAALAQALATAGLDVQGGLSADAAAQAGAGATLTLRVNLEGNAIAQAIASGALDGTGALTATPGYIVDRASRTWRVERAPRTWRVTA